MAGDEGKRLDAWGPNSTPDRPDVSGEVVATRDGGRMLGVREFGQKVLTWVNRDGGWRKLIVTGLVVAVVVPFWSEISNFAAHG